MCQRLRVAIRGAVQGVGFRPFVYRLATELGLPGWVNNSSQGVLIEVEGQREALESFLLRIEPERPPRASIQSLESSFLNPVGYNSFEIVDSDESGEKTVFVLPDIATCTDCLREIFTPSDRRYHYPFTNCTNCGPRFTIIEALPYDRSSTSMKRFRMCPACEREYRDPLDRRFHAQPNACPECGPQLALWDSVGKVMAVRDEALQAAADAIRGGQIVAVKGLGGFHLMTDAGNDDAIYALRERKRREEKPFALMYPSIGCIERDCEVSSLERRLLLSPEAPIVLLKQRSGNTISRGIAPGNPNLGVMLPCTPLHHLLMAELGFPVIATSGNLSDEPICTDENEALDRLAGIADLFLVHDRPIVRHVDDSIVRVMAGREMVLRRARGYAPMPVHLKATKDHKVVLAVGAHLKNSIALVAGQEAFISQHIGDLETPQACDAFQRVIESFETLYEAKPDQVVCDLHPDYFSTRFARKNFTDVVPVQHHLAHVLGCLAENEVEGPALGIGWDGTGYGLDGTIWGGEFLRVDGDSFDRVAHFRTFPLPGGDAAVREPRRIALGLLYEIFGDDLHDARDLATLEAFTSSELDLLRQMVEKRINSPLTSSAGRLFDAAASIAGLRQRSRFEGQAAMDLEFAIGNHLTDQDYPIDLKEADHGLILDWEPLIKGLIADARSGIPAETMAAKFHNSMVEAVVGVASRAGLETIALSGGCFQNKYLTERAIRRLLEEGFSPYWHQRIPPNDGGIAFGQAAGARTSSSACLPER
ncbi:MAG: carbamoyltransferase HypF [Acidobacteriota bacterium]|nr:MAG: carbamoyltransferase HypF [Acidobacteriota bacterium]